MSLTPSQRVLRARIAAHTSWARCPDPRKRTAPARKGFMAKFEKQVDPHGTLPLAERQRRAESALKAHMAKLAYRSAGRAIGYEPPGSPGRAAGPEMWKGHLAVVCDANLLDATIEQLNTECIHLAPVVFPLYPEWEEGQWLDMINDEETRIQYSRYWRQVGFKNAPDARPSHWRDMAERMHQLAEADVVAAAA